MNAVPNITSGTGQYKAVCHKCQRVETDADATVCECGFPMLLEPMKSGPLTVRDILDRSTIEVKGRAMAPLPGVNRTERQKKQMLENMRKRMQTGSIPEPAPALVDRTGASSAPIHPKCHRSVTDTPIYSEPEDTFIFRSQQRADTYQVQYYPQDLEATAVNLYSRPRVGMILACLSAVVLTLITVAGV